MESPAAGSGQAPMYNSGGGRHPTHTAPGKADESDNGILTNSLQDVNPVVENRIVRLHAL